MKYVTIASTFSGNKGAASMLEASIQTITKQDKAAEFFVFTVYPEQDAAMNTYQNVTILSAKPLFLGAVINPLALLYKLLPPLRKRLRKQPHIRAIAEADVFLDQGGITFVDGRAKFLIYNVATILPAMFMGRRVVKCSQAMGPFTGINKFVSKLILPRVDTICARGALTLEYLKGLGLTNVVESTDYAFLMDISQPEAQAADTLLAATGFAFGEKDKTVAIMPSEVVRKKTEASGQDYVGYNVAFIQDLVARGYHVLLMAYSARANHESRHNNDLLVCREIANQLDNQAFTFIDQELTAQQLRHIIGRMDLVVTSRFHAMVASLAMGVPPLIVGWSHKYAEIMDMFNLKDSALDSGKLDQAALRVAFDRLVQNKQKAEAAIAKNLPAVKKNAQQQVAVIVGR